MPDLVWTREPPSEPRQFWYVECPEYADPFVAMTHEHTDRPGVICIAGRPVADWNCRWAGPLTTPQEPEDG